LQNDERLSKLDENEMKSRIGKERWRNFMMPFEHKIDDYNFGTLIRADCKEDYTEQNSIFGEAAAPSSTTTQKNTDPAPRC
jgi:hypothetical protein